MIPVVAGCFSFGPFHLDTTERVLRREGTIVVLAPKAFEILAVLVQNSGHVVSKEDLIQAVWPDTFVEENNLTVHISALRKSLDEGLIETIPRRGYRFTAAITQAAQLGSVSEPAPALLIHEVTRTDIVVEDATQHSRRAWFVTIGASIAAALGGVAYLRLRPALPLESAVAILPFRPIGGAPEIGLGLADSLITRLGGGGRINVRPTASVRRFTGTNTDPVAAGHQLGVDCVLDGSVQQEGDRIRLSVQLIRVADGKQIWGETFDQEFRSIFGIEDEISKQVASALSAKLRVDGSIASRSTPNSDAYRLFLIGRHLIKQWNHPQVLKGIKLTEECVAKDPNFAAGYSTIALGYQFLSLYGGMETREALTKIRLYAQKALALDDNLAEAHSQMAMVKIVGDWDWAGGEREWRRALELDPNDMGGLDGKATQEICMGQFDECLKTRIKLRDLDPTLPVGHLGPSWPLYYSGRYEESMVHVRRALELDPQFARGYADLSIVYRLMGRVTETVDYSLKAMELNAADPDMIAQLRKAARQSGLAAYDRKRLEMALANPKTPVFGLAGLYQNVGDFEKSLDCLEKAVDTHQAQLIFLGTFPGWKPMRQDPRFQKLLVRLNLEPRRFV